MHINDAFDVEDNYIPGFENITDNTGNFTITPELLNINGPGLPPNGFGTTNKYWDLEVISYDSVKRTLPN